MTLGRLELPDLGRIWFDKSPHSPPKRRARASIEFWPCSSIWATESFKHSLFIENNYKLYVFSCTQNKKIFSCKFRREIFFLFYSFCSSLKYLPLCSSSDGESAISYTYYNDSLLICFRWRIEQSIIFNNVIILLKNVS